MINLMISKVIIYVINQVIVQVIVQVISQVISLSQAEATHAARSDRAVTMADRGGGAKPGAFSALALRAENIPKALSDYKYKNTLLPTFFLNGCTTRSD
ncbi:MAG: hypothetical protein ACK562_02660 [Acidobacteriota bacterium]